MLDLKETQTWIARLEKLVARKFGAERGTLMQRMRKVGRRVPKSVHADVKTVIEAARIAGHPKRARTIDTNQVTQAYQRALEHLEAVDVKELRKGQLLSITGAVMFNLLALIVIVIVVLRWRGLI